MSLTFGVGSVTGPTNCDQIVADQELHGRVDLVLEICEVLNRHIQLNRVKVDDHAGDFGSVLVPDHGRHMLVDGGANDLLARLSGGLGEVLRVEHRIDLLLVAGRALVSSHGTSTSSDLLELLLLLRGLHCHLLVHI